MSFAFDSPGERRELWTVSELTRYIRELFEIDYRLQELQVEGELSNFKQARSGHLYFTMKDDEAQLKCVMWRSRAERLSYLPSDGDAVVARGHISVYEAGGVYQLYADELVPAGRGDLSAAFEELKRQLEAEGLFAAEHKKALPAFPRRIGIVTSADAAALRDILNVLKRRCPFISVLIAPTLVQGNEAPPQIVRALTWLDGRRDVDTIILARGGGSIEDLWAFNDERVAQAIFKAYHPIVCGVGHETDFTIADFVADVRAPTPSAAAELAVPDAAELRPQIAGFQNRLLGHVRSKIEERHWRVQSLLRNLRHLGPHVQLAGSRQRLDTLVGRLEQALWRRLDRAQNRTAIAEARLSSVGPQATLARGYAIVRGVDDRLIRRVDQVSLGDRLSVKVADGEFGAEVVE